MNNKLLIPLLALVLLLLGGLWYGSNAGEDDRRTMERGAIEVDGSGNAQGQTQLPDLQPLAQTSARVSSEIAGVAEPLAEKPSAQQAPPSNAVWIPGRVLFPDGLPNDAGGVTVTARGRAFGKSSRREHTVKVDRDGEFRIAFAEGTRIGWLEVKGRYLYMPEKLSVKPHKVTQPVLLEPEMGGVIRGVVRAPMGEQWDEAALDGALIVVSSRSGRKRITRNGKIGSAGRFEIFGVAPGEYRPRVNTPLWADYREEKHNLRSGDTLELDIQLDRGSVISGRVVDEEDVGRGGIGVEVTSTGDSWAREFVLSDDDGYFTLRGVPEGEFLIKAAAEEQLVAEQDLGFIAAGSKREGVLLKTKVGNSIQGFVRWPDGSAAVGAWVSVSQDREVDGLTLDFDDSTSEKTGADGSFEITGLEDADCVVRATGKSFRPADIAKAKKREETGKKPRLRARGPTYRVRKRGVTPGTRGLELVLDPGDTISGRVLDDRGEGLTRFVVQATPQGEGGFRNRDAVRRVVVSPDGSFTVDGLRPGQWDVRIMADDHELTEKVTVALPSSGEVEFVANRLARVSGVVRDPSGKPMSGAGIWSEELREGEDFLADVVARRWGEKARTNREGIFKALDMPPGRLRVWASAEGYGSSQAQLVIVEPGSQVENISLQLRLPGRIRGTLHGSIVFREERAINLSVTEGRSFIPQTKTDSRGEFEFDGLDAGAYRLSLVKSANETSSIEKTVIMEVQVTAGGTLSVVLGSPPANPTLVSGTITRGGEPAEGVPVRCRARKNGNLNNDAVVTGAAGQYLLTLAEPGTYDFTLGDPDTGVIREERELVTGENAGVDFELPTSSLGGVVLGLNGSGIAGCGLRLLPISGAEGEQKPTEQWVRSQGDGQFTFQNVVPGTYNLRIYDRQHGRWERRGSRVFPGTQVAEGLTVAKDESLLGLKFQLEEEGKIRGTVLDSAGTPVSRAELFVWTQSGVELHGRSSGRTDSDGQFIIYGVGVERVMVEANKEGQSSSREPLRVLPGQVSELTLQLDVD